MRSIRSTNNRVRRKAGLVPRYRLNFTRVIRELASARIPEGLVIISAGNDVADISDERRDEITRIMMGRMQSIPFVLTDEERAAAGLQ